jgi:cathepsin B
LTSYGFGFVDNEEKIKQDILSYGPVTAAFTVYEDFLTYKTGVYQHTTGSALGGHAIKVIGWGNESDTDYWLVVNSWNETWGDKGLFKIKMGDCGINRQMHAGQV